MVSQGSSDWKSSNVSASQIALKAESVIQSLSGVDAAISMKIHIPKVGDGTGYFVNRFQSPSVFRLEYPQFIPTGLAQGVLIFNNGKVARFSRLIPGVRVKKGDPEFNTSNDALFLESFPKSFPRFVFAKKLGGNNIVSRFIALAGKHTAGYTLKVEERIANFKGRSAKNFRIVASRAQKGKLPAARVEMIFDAEIGLPVNIQSKYGAYSAGWLSAWRNHQKFDATLFKVPF